MPFIFYSQFLTTPARAILMSSRVLSSATKKDGTKASRDDPIPSRRQLVPPFIPSRDIPRGAIQAIQSIFSYAIMLAVM